MTEIANADLQWIGSKRMTGHDTQTNRAEQSSDHDVSLAVLIERRTLILNQDQIVLVSRFPKLVSFRGARFTNFEIERTLATYRSSVGFGSEVRLTNAAAMIRTSEPP